MSLIRGKLETLVDKTYLVSITDIARSLKVEVKDDRIQLDQLTSYTLNELQEIMLTALSWQEYIETRKSIIDHVVNEQTQKVNKIEADAKLDYMNDQKFARGSKATADLYVEGIQEIIEVRKKISSYKVYGEYLKSLAKLMESIHYSCKHLMAAGVKNAINNYNS